MVWTVLLLFALVGLVGLSLDWGKAAWNVHELNNAADAGALAGAQVVKTDGAQARLMAIALAFANRAEGLPVTVADNPANAVDGEVVLGRWIRQEARFIETDVAPNAVKVVGNRLGQRDDAPPLRLHFGRVFRQSTVEVSRRAIAWSRGSTGAGIIVLADDPSTYPGWHHATGLLMDGGAVVDLRGVNPVTGEEMIGDVQVNATSEDSPWAAFRLNGGSAEIWAGEFNVVGGTRPDADDAGAWAAVYGDPTSPFSVNPRSPRIEDPLAGLIAPDISTMPPGRDTAGKVYFDPVAKTFETVSGGNVTLEPGYYPGGIDMNNGNVVLLPGVYAFGGGSKGKSGLVANGGSLTADGVLIYITGDPQGSKTGTEAAYGAIDLGGNAEIAITSRGDAATPRQIEGEMGLAIWQDRENSTYGKILGTSGMQITGTIYCGYNAMDVGGNADQMGNQLIIGALRLHGNPDLEIAYDGRNSVEAYRSILVQ
jgi:hypothetical protein